MRRRIATSFLVHDLQYLVLRRSMRVRTMRGLWSGVSGTINEGEEPLVRAYAEILEETGMDRGLLELRSSAGPVVIDSAEHGYALDVYGFLFDAGTTDVRLNWENSEYRWVLRGELDSLDTVVGLGGVLDALL